MGIAFIPIYIDYLGMEAYGLIGIFSVLTVWLNLLDVGLTPTLGREMGRFTGGGSSVQSIRDVLRTIEIVAFVVALLMIIICFSGSEWISRSWLNFEGLSFPVVTRSLGIMGIVVALRFIEGIYRSSLMGLQRQVVFNIANGFMVTLRSVGAIAVLEWVSPSIEAFFVWQGIVSLFSVMLFYGLTHASIPKCEFGGRFSLVALRSIWKFAGGVTVIAIIAFFNTQIDKILLSKYLELKQFAYYALAATVSGVVFMFVAPVANAYYPRLNELHVSDKYEEYKRVFHEGAQLISAVVGSIAIVISFYSCLLLDLWTNNIEVVAGSASLLSILTVGNLINGLLYMPYNAQLSYGWTSLTAKLGLLSAVLTAILVAIYVPHYGMIAAAIIWAAVRSFQLLFGAHFMFRKILIDEKYKWYFEDIVAPLSASTVCVSLIYYLVPVPSGKVLQLLFLLTVFCFSLTSSVASSSRLRDKFVSVMFRRLRYE